MKEQIGIGTKIKDLIVKLDITQAYVSELTGIDSGYMSRIINNKIVPGVQILTKIADVLGVPVSYFYDDLEEKETAQLILPKELQEFVTKPENREYLYLAKDMANSGISPGSIRSIMDAWTKSIVEYQESKIDKEGEYE